jgi:hypothetical protein
MFIQAIAVQERSVVVKAPDFYYREKCKLDFFNINRYLYSF